MVAEILKQGTAKVNDIRRCAEMEKAAKNKLHEVVDNGKNLKNVTKDIEKAQKAMDAQGRAQITLQKLETGDKLHAVKDSNFSKYEASFRNKYNY